MNYDVFISYSRKDLQIVQQIKDDIETATAGRCWMDLNGIESGAVQFTSDIVNGIKECRVFLFMLSVHSQYSEFALRELNFAYNKAKENKKKVVIVNIDNCKMEDEFSFMYGLTDTISWNEMPQRKKLIRDLIRWTACKDSTNGKIHEVHRPIQMHSYGLLMVVDESKTTVVNQIFKSGPIISESTIHVATANKDQSFLGLDLYQNDSDEFEVDPQDCIFLGHKELGWGEPVPPGTPLDVILSRDECGIIKATVVCKDIRVTHIVVQ